MISAGIDLAAEPKGTALAVIDWSNEKAKLVFLKVGMDDKALLEETINADKIGIDCALGWPIEFVEFIANHNNPDSISSQVDGGMDWRRTLAYRETDRVVQRQTGRWPLSVSTDRLGLTAMRCAGLLGRLQTSGISIDRAGSGTVVEVYPGASLRGWGFDTSGYRVSSEARTSVLEKIKLEAPWLDLQSFGSLMIESSDAFDAVIASLAARAVYLDLYTKPNDDQLDSAIVEGWIALPTGGIEELI